MNYKKMPTGYGIVQTEVMKLKTISIQAKALYSYLASITGSKEFCFPKQETIANDLCISRQYVSRLIKELIDNKLLVKDKLYNDTRQNKKYYVLYLDQNEDITPSVNHSLQSESTIDYTINNNINNNNIINKSDKSLALKKEKSDNKNTNELKQYYIDFLKDNDYNNTDVIFNDSKQRRQLYNLLSKFTEVSELEAFLRKAKKNDFVVRNNYVPSILVSQFSQIAMSKDDWIKASF